MGVGGLVVNKKRNVRVEKKVGRHSGAPVCVCVRQRQSTAGGGDDNTERVSEVVSVCICD